VRGARGPPATAHGVTFLNLEDESGMLNVTCSEGLWARYRTVAVSSTALLVRGRLERSPEGVLNLVADRLQRLASTVPVKSACPGRAGTTTPPTSPAAPRSTRPCRPPPTRVSTAWFTR
jgi:DNA polymerase III alpha subunit